MRPVLGDLEVLKSLLDPAMPDRARVPGLQLAAVAEVAAACLQLEARTR